MTYDSVSEIKRRDFLKLVSALTVGGVASSALGDPGRRIAVTIDAGDKAASDGPVVWAAGQLRNAVSAKGIDCHIVPSPDEVTHADFWIAVAGPNSRLAKGFHASSADQLTTAESIRFSTGHLAGSPAILVSAIDTRGFVYGLLELAEIAQFHRDPLAALAEIKAYEESPANDIRSIGRYFCSELEDKPWYNDKEFWRGYLDLLAASRFNRFNFAFGLEYDFPRGVTSDYLHFPYPYLVEVPGYDVKVVQLATPEGNVLPVAATLSAGERQSNFDMLRFIASETGKRGLHFQLGIWTHAYQWTDSPNAYHRIDGLTPETHAQYCRDALSIILKECPEIQGLTLRVHGESGIPEGSYPFWKTLFEAISGCGRKIEIDMHAKGVNQLMIDMATATGMPVKLGAKYSAEHQSLGYHQADIRALEIPKAEASESKLFSVSGGARLFTRYGYADFLQEDKHYELLFRLWPGTQRHLLSGDPAMAAAYARSSGFCGAAGLDIMEPLTFKGREGSGQPGGRCAYADESLNPAADWKKFEYFYRVWGRCLYNPDADPEAWRRYLRHDFGPGTSSVESALANASRILPLVTSAHLPSASNHAFWPELYENMPIVRGGHSPYGDTPEPKCFGTVSPLDPQLFSTVTEHAADLVAGRLNAKYSPVEVAQWLEDYAAAAGQALSEARTSVPARSSPEFRRVEEDILIQIGLGSFFAAKLRCATLFEIHQQTGYPEAGKLALDEYKKGRDAWARMAERANRIYLANVSYGDIPMRRGHWSDRLPAIDKDIAAMQGRIESRQAGSSTPQGAERAIRAAVGRPNRAKFECQHTTPSMFHPGEPLLLSLRSSAETTQHSPTSVALHYRHVNQGERWQSVEMRSQPAAHTVEIPGDYTNSPFPLQYYFELRRGDEGSWFYPAFNSTLSNQPYYAVWRRSV